MQDAPTSSRQHGWIVQFWRCYTTSFLVMCPTIGQVGLVCLRPGPVPHESNGFQMQAIFQSRKDRGWFRGLAKVERRESQLACVFCAGLPLRRHLQPRSYREYWRRFVSVDEADRYG